MVIQWKFPIRYKILAVLSCVVVAAVALYLYLASRLFFEDKTLLVYELNQGNVSTLASDVETDLIRIIDKLKLVATVHAVNPANFSRFFSEEEELVRVSYYEIDSAGVENRIFGHTWSRFLEQYGKDAAYLEKVRQKIPVPYAKVKSEGIWIRNATLPEEGNPPLMTVAIAVDSDKSNGVSRILFADVRLDRILSTFSRAGIAQIYAADSEGHVLADSNQSRVIRDESLMQDPLYQTASQTQIRSEVKRFLDEKEFLGSYSKLGFGKIVVLSKVELGAAFAAVRTLVRKSLIYAALVITVAFLIALFFSHSLTAPIHRMLEATRRIAKGDFGNLVHVASHDELAVLAASFNTMTVDLKNSREQIIEYSRDLEKKVADRTAKLESQNRTIKETQEALITTTRLASVGETAGRAAHEILNPLTNINARLEKMRNIDWQADFNDLKLLHDIISAWLKTYKEKGLSGLVEELGAPSSVLQGKSLLEEDLSNLLSIGGDLGKRQIEHRANLDFLLKESGRINKIVSQMRQLTRVSGNRGAVSVIKLVEDSLTTMEDVLKKRSIQTEIRRLTSDQTPRVMADHDELLQVMTNLLRNSMQAIEEAQKDARPVGNPAKIWVTVDKKGDQVLLRVCDNGPGIPKENFEKIFEPSFTTKTVEEGTGLGLAIARRFIRAHGGEIILEKSTPGLETVFLIELPENV